jgi:Ala-tRNA(Pro) deacylase
MEYLKLLQLLHDSEIVFALHEHPPLFTVEEAFEFNRAIEGGHSKNLFLKDKKNQFFLVSVLEHKRVDLKQLSKTCGQGGLSFAKAEDLKAILNLMPGSVTPYGLMHDVGCQVMFLLDQDLISHPKVNFHPLRNDMTVSVDSLDFLKFCTIVQHTPSIINIPVL